MKLRLPYLIPLFLTIFLVQNARAQTGMVRQAVQALQEGDLDGARLKIDSAAVHPESKGQHTTWYYRGFVYKELYNQREKSNYYSSARKESITSFKAFLDMEEIPEDLAKSAGKSLMYLATTHFNDAATNLNPENYQVAEENYQAYKTTVQVVQPDADFNARDIQFYLVLGSVFTKIYEADRKENRAYYNKIEEAFQKVLDIDSLNLSANYNLGIHYYNEAVNIIKTLDYGTDIITLEQIQDECVELFRQSLPYMKIAYELNPKRKETLIGLAGIYFSLNEMEKSEAVQNELKLLEEKE